MTESRRSGESTALSCRHLWKVFGKHPQKFFANQNGVVDDVPGFAAEIRDSGHIVGVCDVSFSVAQGEIFVIMGLSGSGKSTIARCLSRLIEPTAGEVEIAGQDILSLNERELIELRRHTMGMVFQHFGLIPHLSVLENVAYPLRVQGVDVDVREARAREVIHLVGLDGEELRLPFELSGGMQQRVGIARSLAVEPDIWFLDEPFSALDPIMKRQMQDEFIRLQNILNKTIIFITHDFDEALRIADRVAIMRDGCIVQIAAPADMVLHPADDYVAEFTRNVPRSRVLTARSICRPVTAEMDDIQSCVAASTILDEVIPKIVGREKPIPVVRKSGDVIGQVSSEDVLVGLNERYEK